MSAPTLASLLEDIPPSLLDQQCPDVYLADVSRQLTKWKLLSPYLGISRSEQHSITESFRDYDEQKQELLYKWKENHASAATYRALIGAIHKSGNNDLAYNACELLRQQSSQIRDGACSTVSVLSPTIEKYQCKLKSGYRTQKLVMVVEWPPPPALKYISLTLIEKEIVQRGEIKDELIHASICGTMADIHPNEVEVELEQLLSLDSDERKVILFEGAPGSGKSTLLWYICQKWQSGELFQQFSLVLLVLLRDTTVHNAQCLADILPYLPSRICENIASEIEDNQGEGVLIMLDGWDETPVRLRQKGSLFHDLISAPSKSSVHVEKAVVVVSSRPSASRDLGRYLTHRVEVRGFTKEKRELYIRESLKDDVQSAQILLEEIEDITNEELNLNLPLSVVILTHTFLSSGCKLPSTFCRIIITLARCCLLRHIKKQPNGDSVDALESFDDLPKGSRESFLKLCKVAYEGIVNEKYSFASEDIIEITESSITDRPQIATFGLLQSMHSFVATGSATVYHFLHLSLQELCAAYHVVSLPDPETTHNKALQTIMTPTFKPTDKTEYFHFEPVCNFYSALTGLQNLSIAKQLQSTYRLYDSLYTEEETLQSRIDFLAYIRMIFHSDSESDNSDNKHDSSSENDERDSDSKNDLVELVTCFGFSQKVSRALCNKQHLRKLEIRKGNCIHDFADFKYILEVLQTCPNIKDVKIHVKFSESVADIAATQLSNVLKQKDIKKFEIDAHNSIRDDGIVALVPALSSMFTPQVGSRSLKIFTGTFLQNSSLRYLTIDVGQYLQTGGDDREFFGCLKSAALLTEVEICSRSGKPSLSDTSVGRALLAGDLVELADILGLNNSPTVDKILHLHVYVNACIEVDFKNKCFSSVGLIECQYKHHYYLMYEVTVKCKMGPTEMERLSATLQEVPVKELNLSTHQIGDEGVTYLGKAISQILCLEELIIRSCGIDEDGIASLFSGLASNTTLASLDVSMNSFGDSGAIRLAKMINQTTIQKLDISCCNVEEDGITALASALRANTTLKKLNIYSRDKISDQSELELARMLVHNATLYSLCVNQNPSQLPLDFHDCYDNFYPTFEITRLSTPSLLTDISVSVFYAGIKSSSVIKVLEIDNTTSLGQALWAGNMEEAADILQLHQPPLGNKTLTIHEWQHMESRLEGKVYEGNG